MTFLGNGFFWVSVVTIFRVDKPIFSTTQTPPALIQNCHKNRTESLHSKKLNLVIVSPLNFEQYCKIVQLDLPENPEKLNRSMLKYSFL